MNPPTAQVLAACASARLRDAHSILDGSTLWPPTPQLANRVEYAARILADAERLLELLVEKELLVPYKALPPAAKALPR